MLPTTRLFCFALLLTVGLGACQRASYSFLPVAAAGYLTPAKAPATVAAPGAQLPADSARPTAEAYPAPVARRPRRLHRRAAAVASRPQAVARPQAATLPRLLAAWPRLRPAHGPASSASDRPVRYRSKGIALLLLVGGFLLLGPVGLHNFYLGRPELGVLGLVATYFCLFLVVLSAWGAIGGSIGTAGVVGLSGLIALAAWQLTDLVRIITGDLKPRNGDYNPRLFQTRPDRPTAAMPPR